MISFVFYAGRLNFQKVEYDQWWEKDNDSLRPGINIEDGDEVLVTWPDGSIIEKKLHIKEEIRTESKDDGYGSWWTENCHTRKAYFIYKYRGIKHEIYLRFANRDNITFEISEKTFERANCRILSLKEKYERKFKA